MLEPDTNSCLSRFAATVTKSTTKIIGSMAYLFSTKLRYSIWFSKTFMYMRRRHQRKRRKKRLRKKSRQKLGNQKPQAKLVKSISFTCYFNTKQILTSRLFSWRPPSIQILTKQKKRKNTSSCSFFRKRTHGFTKNTPTSQ